MATLARHQVAAGAATALDFAVMIALVELVHVRHSFAAFAGAAAGACFNFWLGRTWVFRAGKARRTGLDQAGRYALVALGSALLNAGLEELFVVGLHVPYVAARVAGSIGVGLCWNYPLQKRFVFAATNERGLENAPQEALDDAPEDPDLR